MLFLVLQNTIPLSTQLEYYKEYQKKVVKLVGKVNATSLINGSVHFVSAGSSDFLQNYFVNPLLFEAYTPDQFSDILIKSYAKFVQVEKGSIYQFNFLICHIKPMPVPENGAI